METALKDEFTCYFNFVYPHIELFHFKINKLTYVITDKKVFYSQC